LFTCSLVQLFGCSNIPEFSHPHRLHSLSGLAPITPPINQSNKYKLAKGKRQLAIKPLTN
jgi:hypothetical protein